MTKIWQAREAEARFGAFLEASLTEGPQIVTRRGVETAVLVPIEQWCRLKRSAKPNLKDLLLAVEPRTEMLTPPRERHLHRSTPVLDWGLWTAGR